MQASMENYPRAAVERAMKVQEVILRAMAKKLTWWQAAEIIGISDRQMRRSTPASRNRSPGTPAVAGAIRAARL
ncbi:MAG: hypothetical protein WCE63_04920 [Acidobacteriaceae bacterium]